MSSGFNVIRRHSLDATGIRIKELTQALATSRSKLEGSAMETDDVRSIGRMDHSTIKLNDERLSFATTLNASNTDFYYELPYEPDLNYLKVWLMLDHLGSRVRDISGFGNDAHISGHPTLRRALLDLGFQQTRNSPATPVMLFNSGTDAVSQTDGEYIWITDNPTIRFTNFSSGFSIHFRFCCLNFAMHHTAEGGQYSRRFASKTDDANNGWAIIVNDTGNNTGGIEFDILDAGFQYAKRTNGYMAGMWYQVVVTYDRNAGETSDERIKIYTAAQENSVSANYGIILSTTFNLRIGARSSGTGFFYGYIHDFRMYMGKILTQEEITNVCDNEITIEATPKGQIFIIQYALIQQSFTSKRHKWVTVGRIIKVKIHKFNVIKSISLSKIHRWNQFMFVTPIKTHKWNILELVERLLTIVYDQAGAIIKTKTHKFNTIGHITRTHTHKWDVAGPAQILTTQYKRFTKSTTAGSNITQDIAFDSTPQALIVWSDGTTSNNAYNNGYQTYYGFSDGTHNCCVSGYAEDNVTTTNTFGGLKTNKAISMMYTTLGTVASEATVSFTTNNARFTWTTNDNRAVYIHCMAIWGVTAAEVKNFTTGQATTGTRTYSLNNASLLPSFLNVITISNPATWSQSYANAVAIGAGTSSSSRWAIGNSTEDAAVTSSDYYARSMYTESSVYVGIDDDTGAVESLANISSFNTGNFVLNWTDAPPSSTTDFAALVIDTGGQAIIDCGSFSEPGTTGTQNISTAATINQTKGVMVFSSGQSTTGMQYDNFMSIGGGSGTGSTVQGVVSVADDDVSTATVTARINKTGSIVKVITPAASAASSTTRYEAALSALGTDQFSLNWTTRSGTRRCHYIAFGTA